MSKNIKVKFKLILIYVTEIIWKNIRINKRFQLDNGKTSNARVRKFLSKIGTTILKDLLIIVEKWISISNTTHDDTETHKLTVVKI